MISKVTILLIAHSGILIDTLEITFTIINILHDINFFTILIKNLNIKCK